MAQQNPNQGRNQPSRPSRHISGPQSALTDFLASHNISANQIRDDALRRRRQAAQQGGQEEQENGDNATQEEVVVVTSGTAEAGPSRRRSTRGGASDDKSRKKEEEAKAIEKIKSSKSFKKRKKKHHDDDEDDDELARALFEQHHAPLPGQMDNCAMCQKRFTVTPYSVAGPEGGLLCATCGRQVAKERESGQPKKKAKKQAAPGGVGRRRTIQSRILDGDVGVKSLATLCVQMLAKNVDLADSLGDLPEHLVDKIARIFSKRRLLKPETLPLFVQPTTETIHIYDGSKLGEQDYVGIFQVANNINRVKIRCGIHFKDEVMDYLLSRDLALEHFYLHGANLLSDEKWHAFFAHQGKTLKSVQVYYTDNHFGDESIKVLGEHCPNLKRLKIEHNQKLTSQGVKDIGELPNLEHVSLQMLQPPSSQAICDMVESIGQNLQTLSLTIAPKADDTVLQIIHQHCRSLSKFRITDSESMTDHGFSKLFTGWKNPPLQFIDLQKCRQLDAANPRENPDSVGLCSDGFKAIMAHSGRRLRYFNIHACRHISREAFEEVFDENAHYPELRKLEISFCEEVTDFILGCIFRACPNIKEVNVFGCMKVKDVRVPRGIIVVGIPNALGMITEGVYD